MRLAAFLLLNLGIANALPQPQNFLSDIKSALGIPDDKPTTTPPKTLAPPITASLTNAKSTSTAKSTQTPSSNSPSPTVSSTATISNKSKSTSTDSSTITSTSSDSSTDSSTITAAPITSTTNTPSSTSSTTSSATAIPDVPPQASSSSSGVSPGGIVVAVIMSLAVVAAIAWLLFRYHPGIRRWWLAREEKKREERSYRSTIDGPFHKGGPGVRNAALSSPSVSSRRSMLQSFFAPRTVTLGDGKEIRRKPVNWGSTDPVPPMPPMGPGMEKVALTDMAAPMARTESTRSDFSYLSRSASAAQGYGAAGRDNGFTAAGPGVRRKELPPMPELPSMPELPPQTVSSRAPQLPELSPVTTPSISTPTRALSPMSSLSRSHSIAELAPTPPRTPQPPMPPVPLTPSEPQRNVHGILSRKSIYELA